MHRIQELHNYAIRVGSQICNNYMNLQNDVVEVEKELKEYRLKIICKKV